MDQIEDKEKFEIIEKQRKIDDIQEMLRINLHLKNMEVDLKNANKDKLPKIRKSTKEEEEEMANLAKSDLQIELEKSKLRISGLLKEMDDNNNQLQ